jgi:hypothetical protein
MNNKTQGDTKMEKGFVTIQKDGTILLSFLSVRDGVIGKIYHETRNQMLAAGAKDGDYQMQKCIIACWKKFNLPVEVSEA